MSAVTLLPRFQGLNVRNNWRIPSVCIFVYIFILMNVLIHLLSNSLSTLSFVNKKLLLISIPKIEEMIRFPN